MTSILAPPAPAGLEPGPEVSFSVLDRRVQRRRAHRRGARLGARPDEGAARGDRLRRRVDGRPRPRAGSLPRADHADPEGERGRGDGQERGRPRSVAATSWSSWTRTTCYLPGRLAALAELAWARPDLDVLTSDAVLEVDGEAVRRCYTPELPFEVDDQRSAILAPQLRLRPGRGAPGALPRGRRVRRVPPVRDGLGSLGAADPRRLARGGRAWSRSRATGSAAGSLSGSRANLIAGRVRVLEQAAAASVPV